MTDRNPACTCTPTCNCPDCSCGVEILNAKADCLCGSNCNCGPSTICLPA